MQQSPFLIKGQGHRYSLKVEKHGFVSMEQFKTLKRFYEENPKILIRRIISRQDRLLACFTDKQLVFTKDLNPFIITDKSFRTKYVLALLNSCLFSYLYLKSSSIATKDDFRQTTLSELRILPIAKIVIEKQEIFEEKVFLLEKALANIYSLTTRFLHLLQAKYPTLTPTRKLEQWPDLSPADFLKEIKKQKVAWSLREEAEWLEHLAAEQGAARTLQQQIAATDRAIDELVYTLYGLTPEEVALVEGKG